MRKSSFTRFIPRFLYAPLLRSYLSFRYLSDFLRFRAKAQKDNRFSLLWRDRLPQLFDNTSATNFDTHYIYHPAWAARILAKTQPKEHIDIASTLSFSSIVSAFLPVRFYDYRPAHLPLTGLQSAQADLRALPFADDSIPSLSCMHAMEHIGLGRYGDPLEPGADITAAKELTRVLARNGNLLFVVPVGKSKIAYNAHRIYSYAQVRKLFPTLVLKEFSLVPDGALTCGMLENATEQESDAQTYGCGCFWFVKE